MTHQGVLMKSTASVRAVSISAAQPVIGPRDLVAGLGSASRDLLAACLALFEDSTLQKRLTNLLKSWTTKVMPRGEGAADVGHAADLLRHTIDTIRDSLVTDDALRVRLWIYLRSAFSLSPCTFGTLRSAATSADDLVATALHKLQPGLVAKQWDWLKHRTGMGTPVEVPDGFDALARKTLEELAAQVMAGTDAASKEARDCVLAELRERVKGLNAENQKVLMDAIGVDQLNDEALLKILMTGGGLAALNVGVGMAGFAAYILAAKISAFIPLVSGPALVSLLAVLSNPITLVLGTLSMGWLVTSSAEGQIQRAVALRVMSLLALHGLSSGEGGLRGAALSFHALPEMRPMGRLDDTRLRPYRDDWAVIAPAHRQLEPLDKGIAYLMERCPHGERGQSRWGKLLKADPDAASDTAILASLTLGDLVYNLHRLDPNVLQAADFSRAEDLADPIEFASFAHRIAEMGADSELGAFSNLKGYVAEQLVAAQLLEQGHIVEFPATSNQAGWDLSVDGVKFQVKNASDLSLLHRHFDMGYDYPVIANSEVADMLAGHVPDTLPDWADQVHFVEGYSQSAVEHATHQTLDAGDDLLHPDVPVFAVMLVGLRHLQRFNGGELSATQAVQEILVDGTVRAGLAVAGNYAGVTVGLLAFGPAGALVLGSALPVLSRWHATSVKKGLDALVRSDSYKAWDRDCREALGTLIDVLKCKLQDKAERMKQRVPDPSANVVGRYLRWRVEDELRFLREAWCRVKVIGADAAVPMEQVGPLLLTWLSTSTLHPVVYQAPLREWSAIMSKRPALGERVVETIEDLGKKTIDGCAEMVDKLRRWSFQGKKG